MTETQAHDEIERRIAALASGALKDADGVNAAIKAIKRGMQFTPEIGLIVNLAEVLKKAAHKKYRCRFGWRWLSSVEQQIAIYNAILEKGSNE